MDWLAGKVGTIYQKPAHAISLSTPPIGCVLDLPGVPGGGNKIYDRSPYGNHGTITGAVWKRLPSGLWYLDFDGLDDYVAIPDADSLTLASGFTLELWINLDLYGNGGGLITKAGEFQFFLGGYTDVLARDAIDGGYRGRRTTAYGAAYLDGTGWHQMIATYDGGTVYSGFKIYGDTVQVDNTDYSSDAFTTIRNTAGVTYIGSLDGSGWFFEGGFALPRIYNRVLSELEIQNHFNRTKHLFGV